MKKTTPSFIDKAFIKTLSKEKKTYWSNRMKNKPGQGETKLEPKMFKQSDVRTSLDNQGNEIVHNRATRRQRPLKLNIFTKATQSIRKERLRNANKRRLRAIAKARKARRESYSQVA